VATLIDASILIAAERGRLDWDRVLAEHAAEETALAARVHARVWAELAAKGVGVGAHDLLIGATALAIGGRVATRDLRSFLRIPGLEVTHW